MEVYPLDNPLLMGDPNADNVFFTSDRQPQPR